MPYSIASDIQDDYLECSSCSVFVLKQDKKEHAKTHPALTEFKRPYNELLLRPGLGHIELNMAKKLLRFTWIPFMKDLSLKFGFRTPKAQEVFKKGTDHHRSREVLEIVLFALSKELLVPYIRHCIQNALTPTASHYNTWFEEDVVDQRYCFLYHITFSYLLAFHMFNEGVRKNNSNIILAGRTTFHPLFFHGNHPKYKKLHLRDMIERVKLPGDIIEYFKETESFSKSGLGNRGQGADFIHEEINRDVKSFLPKSGVPTKQTWVNIIRKMESLQTMKNALLSQRNIESSSSKKRPKKFHHEEVMTRKMFRKEKYLVGTESKETFRSLNGESLDHTLCDFNLVLKNNYRLYKEEYSKIGEFSSSIHNTS